jgi:hypothetical protein
MVNDLYDADILEWSERQADLLRRVAAGERLNDNAPDWPNIIEEIESVGRSQLTAVRSLLTQALLHMLKADAWPNSSAVLGWQAESVRFRVDAADIFAPSMRQHIDIEKLYARARRMMPKMIDGEPPLPVPETCLMTLDELLDEGGPC